MAKQSQEQLLNTWDNRPSAFFEADDATRMEQEIAILEALENMGCLATRDGELVKGQLNERRDVLRDMRRGK